MKSTRIINIILLLFLMLSSINIYAYDFEVDGVYYNIIASDQVEVTYKEYSDYLYWSDYSGNVQIPSIITYDGINYSVTQIGEDAFWNCKELTSISIPNSVTSINNQAFWYCFGLTSITIPNSVTSIGDRAFSGCMYMTSITIPSSVTYIGTGAFSTCHGLTSIKVKSGNSTYDSHDNCNAIIETSSNTLIAGCMNTNIPNSVTSIGDYAFYGCISLTSITILNSVTSIGYSAFANCTGLTSISIPNSVTSIDESAFNRCYGLTSITIPNNLTSIGAGAFSGCSSLTSIKVESGNVVYDSRDNCNAIIETSSNTLITGCMSTIIPNSVTSIGKNAFLECNRLTSITIPNSVTSIGAWAFHSCRSLTSISIPNSVTSIDDAAFYNCSADVICYATNVPNTASNAFRASSIQNSDLYVPASSVNSYKAKEPWNYFRSITAIEGSKTYSLSITATGNGSATYEGTTIRGKTKSYTVNEGTSVTITFTPDTGYRIKGLKVNGSSVTVSTSYTTKVNSDTSIEVEFEEIPQVDYTLSIKAVGNGSASYNGETIRETTKNYSVTGGSSITLTFTPDNGYRIKSLKVNGSSVTITSSYTTTINADTSIEVEFEEIPDTPTTYSLTIKATGNGSALYGRETIRNTKKSYTVDEGTSVTITFSPDDGYRIKSLKVNNVDATVGDSYTTKVNADTKVEVEFEEIPVTTYSLSIKAVGNGSATYKNKTVRDDSQTFTVNEGSDVTIAFIPDDGYRIKSVKHDEADVTSNMIDNSYSISDIHADATVEVEFEERVNSFSADGISYQVTSWEAHSLTVVAADDGLIIEIPDKISSQDEEWTVTGIDGNVLDDHEILAAVIWNPEAPFTARVTNPNLLLYVKDEQYAPATIKNVVVNGYANSITLTDAQSGNNFYCPRAFTAGIISYSHRYWMKTGINESRGWETLALPFDVQKISHSTKGEITPFANWHDGDSTYPFWLYQLSANGFIEADAIKANTPYIISMPNNDRYSTEYHLNGRVDFTAKNVEVKRSDDIQTSAFSDRTFIPNFVEQGKNAGYYALNVNNEYEVYQGKEAEGSRFVLNLRQIHPFEAYMTSSANTRSIGIFDGMTTDIRGIEIVANEQTLKVYDLSGKLYKVGTSLEDMKQELPAGVYIVNHQKMIIK